MVPKFIDVTVLKDTSDPFLVSLFQFLKDNPTMFDLVEGESRRGEFERWKKIVTAYIGPQENFKENFILLREKLRSKYDFLGIPESEFELPGYLYLEGKDHHMFDTSLSFTNLLIIIGHVVDDDEPSFLDFKGSKRQASAPLEAFLPRKSIEKRITESLKLSELVNREL